MGNQRLDAALAQLGVARHSFKGFKNEGKEMMDKKREGWRTKRPRSALGDAS
jgi:hypothetical protein